LVAEIHTKVKDLDWQMMDAFIGNLDRHLGEQIEEVAVGRRPQVRGDPVGHEQQLHGGVAKDADDVAGKARRGERLIR
jgi:hypothetical protein